MSTPPFAAFSSRAQFGPGPGGEGACPFARVRAFTGGGGGGGGGFESGFGGGLQLGWQ